MLIDSPALRNDKGAIKNGFYPEDLQNLHEKDTCRLRKRSALFKEFIRNKNIRSNFGIGGTLEDGVIVKHVHNTHFRKVFQKFSEYITIVQLAMNSNLCRLLIC